MACRAISFFRCSMSFAGAIFMATFFPLRLSAPSFTTPLTPSPSLWPSLRVKRVVGSVVASKMLSRALCRLASSAACLGSAGLPPPLPLPSV